MQVDKDPLFRSLLSTSKVVGSHVEPHGDLRFRFWARVSGLERFRA